MGCSVEVGWAPQKILGPLSCNKNINYPLLLAKVEYVLSSSSFELFCPVWTKSQNLVMAKRTSCSWWSSARCRWVGSSQGISSFLLYQIRHKWNLCALLRVGALSCGPACAMGSKELGHLESGFSHKEKRIWFTTFSPLCTGVRGPELPPAPSLVLPCLWREILLCFLRPGEGNHPWSWNCVQV